MSWTCGGLVGGGQQQVHQESSRVTYMPPPFQFSRCHSRAGSFIIPDFTDEETTSGRIKNSLKVGSVFIGGAKITAHVSPTPKSTLSITISLCELVRPWVAVGASKWQEKWRTGPITRWQTSMKTGEWIRNPLKGVRTTIPPYHRAGWSLCWETFLPFFIPTPAFSLHMGPPLSLCLCHFLLWDFPSGTSDTSITICCIIKCALHMSLPLDA